MAGRSRSNRSRLQVDASLNLKPSELKLGRQKASAWHWGLEPKRVVDWKDPVYPRLLIECGRLIRLEFRAPQNKPVLQQRDTMIEFSLEVSKHTRLAFDPEHPDQRLYILLPEPQRRALKARFWDENGVSALDLGRLAQYAGNRHSSNGPYPIVKVKPIGVMVGIVYFTEKRGDGPSWYRHAQGEESGGYPILAVDSKGRLWLAGGEYRAPDAGIAD